MTKQQRLYDLVVIGASAGGIEALSLLMATLPESLSVPIVIAQHLDPNVTSHLGQILTRRSKLPVRTVGENAPEHLVDGVIYVIPADSDVEITDDVIHLLPGMGQHPMPSIDRLLSSAAHAYGERVIAIILTGSGSDGTAGAREVKAAGGAVLIENPATASYPTMPASLSPTTVDLVVDLDRMGPILTDLISGAQNLMSQSASDLLPNLLDKVRQHVGIDFTQYKSPTILRRLHRRMAATGAETLVDYSRYLDERPEEYQRLVASFLINVTEFFRDQPLFAYLCEHVIPEMIAHASGKSLRIWSAGCATGEEPYSIGILLAEALGTEALRFNIRIFATDVDADAITFARRGQYPTASLASMPDTLRARYFTPTEHGYEVAKSIRNMVIFGEHDLGQRAPFPRMDMVVCRNVLIYFTSDLQKRTLQAFAFSLRDGGYLVLGNAETAGALGAYFSLIHPHFRVYRRRGDRVAAPPLPISFDRSRRAYETPVMLATTQPNAHTAEPRIAPAGEQPASTMHANSERAIMHEIGQRVYTSRERFADQILGLPMGVVVIDRNYDVQIINSAAYALLDIHRPAIDKDLLHLATRVPTKPLRAAIDAVFQVGESATTSGAVTVSVELEQSEQENRQALQITCYPSVRADSLVDAAPSETTTPPIEAVILLISETARAKRPHGTAEGAATAPSEGKTQATGRKSTQTQEQIAHLTQQLEAERALNHELRVANQELRETSDNLRRANEDLLVAQEEAQASAEETLTLNEEMQATNEELETLNEEMEATVEELHTTNDDLLARTQELQTLAQEKETQRLASERERAQLEAVLLSMGDALLATDATGKQTLTNEAYRRLFGDADGHLALEDVLGNPLPPEAAPWRRVGAEAPFTLAFTTRAPDGSRRWFEATGQPIRVGETTSGGVVTIRDLSDRSIRGLYERFLGRASHELKTPLTSLMITIQMIQKQLPSDIADERLRTLVTNALKYTRQLDTMANDLKDLQRMQHDKIKLTLEPVDLVALVRQVVDDIEFIQSPDHPHPPIVVQAQPGIESLFVLGDALRIAQIVQNLLSNALRYAPNSKRIDVRVRRTHKQGALDKAELEVQDYGPGIAAEDLGFLFTPFYQAVHDRESQYGGLGLGLYVVQQLVKALGGDIEAHSSPLRGAVFTIWLPLVTEGTQVAAAPSDAQ